MPSDNINLWRFFVFVICVKFVWQLKSKLLKAVSENTINKIVEQINM